MAQRRMFSKEITNSSDFQMMSPSAQALYFHIGMNSDDDGFCEAFTIVRMTESKPDDLSSLNQRGFIYLVDSKVCIVKDWHTNNDIRVDRYSRSKYLDKPQYADIYGIIMEDKIKHLSRYKKMLPSGSTSGITQVRLGEDRILNTSEPTVREERVSENEGREKRLPPAKYPDAKKVFRLFLAYTPALWDRNSTFLNSAQSLHDSKGMEELNELMAWYAKNRKREFCPQFDDPNELAKKYEAISRFFDKTYA